MRPIQLILIAILLAVGVIYFARLRSRLLDRLIVALFLISGVALTLDPDFANNVAHALGVGRGVDLLMYIALTAIAFFLLVIYSYLRELNERVTELARLIALQNASQPSDSASTPSKDQEQ